jgi:hypothetical protein
LFFAQLQREDDLLVAFLSQGILLFGSSYFAFVVLHFQLVFIVRIRMHFLFQGFHVRFVGKFGLDRRGLKSFQFQRKFFGLETQVFYFLVDCFFFLFESSLGFSQTRFVALEQLLVFGLVAVILVFDFLFELYQSFVVLSLEFYLYYF